MLTRMMRLLTKEDRGSRQIYLPWADDNKGQWPGESDRVGVHSASWTTSCETKMCQWDWRGKPPTNAILPVMTHGRKTWSLSNTHQEKLIATQSKMERIMAEGTVKDRKNTNWIRKQSGVTDIIRNKRESKHRWVGHAPRRSTNKWATRVTQWIPRGH